MKIENSGIQNVSPKKTDGIRSTDKKKASVDARPSILGKDHAEVTENARLLAKARASLENSSESEDARLNDLKQQIQDGSYQVPFEELAKRLSSKLIPPQNHAED